MQIKEKLEVFQKFTINVANSESEAMIQEYRESCEKELEEYRAIKQVPKSCVDYDQFRKEALILKDIRHPGIPVVYDLEAKGYNKFSVHYEPVY